MSINKNITKILVLVVFGIMLKLTTGIYQDDEFDEYYFFVKHTPHWQFYFGVPDKQELYGSLMEDKMIKMANHNTSVKNSEIKLDTRDFDGRLTQEELIALETYDTFVTKRVFPFY